MRPYTPLDTFVSAENFRFHGFIAVIVNSGLATSGTAPDVGAVRLSQNSAPNPEQSEDVLSGYSSPRNDQPQSQHGFLVNIEKN